MMQMPGLALLVISHSGKMTGWLVWRVLKAVSLSCGYKASSQLQRHYRLFVPFSALSPSWLQYIKEHFSTDVEAMRAGRYDSWQQQPLSAVAGIVLADQFTR